MPRIYLPSTGPGDWQRLLGDPIKHWRTGFSARTLAYCWEDAESLPLEIATMLSPLGTPLRLLAAFPEHKVPLPGANRGDSQNDLFALVRAGENTIALAIEGKVNEPFDQSLSKWLQNASPGKLKRLAYLRELLGLEGDLPGDLHYQLLHRTASAVIEADNFKTDRAAMIVHSFSPDRLWFDAFARFVSLFGIVAEPNKLLEIRPQATRPLYVGWACGAAKFLSR